MRVNIALIESATASTQYIIGARIKNERNAIKEWILSFSIQDREFAKKNSTKFIVGYSEKRIKKDRYN